MLPQRTKQRVVIDCGGAHVSVGVFSFIGKGLDGDSVARSLRLEAYVREDFVCSPAHAAAWPTQVGTALDLIFARLGLRRACHCRLAIPGHLALTKLAKVPAVAGENLASTIRFETAQAIPFPLDKVAWSGVVTTNDGEEMELLISAAKLDAVEPLFAAAESAQLLPTHCEPTALALWRALSREVHEPVLLVDVGVRSTQVIIGGGGAPLYLRTVNLGGNAVTRSLAQMLGCDFAEAEAAKRRASRSVEEDELPRESESLLRKAVEQAASAFAQKLGSELLLTKLAYLRQSGEVSPKRLYLYGGGSALSGLRGKLAKTLSLPTCELPLPDGMTVAVSSAEGMPIAASDWYTLYGLALGAVLPEGQSLNLLPSSYCAARELQFRRRWWLAAAVLLAFLPLPLLLQQRSAIAVVHARVAAVDATAAPLLRLGASNAQAQTEVNALRLRLDALAKLNVRRESWLSFLADLQAQLNEVGDVWLERLHYNAPTEVARSEADSPGTASIELGGWLLESARSDEALQRLFDGLLALEFVRGVVRERYDRSRPGLIRFDAELTIASEKSL